MAVITTSGTVQTYPYDQRRVIDHSMRRAGRSPTAIVGEEIAFAQDLLYTTLAEWIASGFPIWTRGFSLIGVQQGSADVVTPAGVVDVFHAYWRTLNTYRGPATTSAGADASVLFGGQPNADVVIAGPNAAVIVNFGSPTIVETVGFLLGGNASLTAAIIVETSPDGVTWTVSQILPSTTYQPLAWGYFDMAPTLNAQYVRLRLPVGTWTLNQINIGLANGFDVELGVLNMDDYYNLPNKQFQALRPNSCFVDRPIASPVIKIWPTVNQQGFYQGTVSALTKRYIQDPGLMTNGIEVPARFLEALQWRLAQKLIHELPEDNQSASPSYFTLMAKQQRIDNIEKNAARSEALAWGSERTGGPLRIAPNIKGYTA